MVSFKTSRQTQERASLRNICWCLSLGPVCRPLASTQGSSLRYRATSLSCSSLKVTEVTREMKVSAQIMPRKNRFLYLHTLKRQKRFHVVNVAIIKYYLQIINCSNPSPSRSLSLIQVLEIRWISQDKEDITTLWGFCCVYWREARASRATLKYAIKPESSYWKCHGCVKKTNVHNNSESVFRSTNILMSNQRKQ